jgi:hypothetical protein
VATDAARPCLPFTGDELWHVSAAELFAAERQRAALKLHDGERARMRGKNTPPIPQMAEEVPSRVQLQHLSAENYADGLSQASVHYELPYDMRTLYI